MNNNYSTYYFSPLYTDLLECRTICLKYENPVPKPEDVQEHWEKGGLILDGEKSIEDDKIIFRKENPGDVKYNVIYFFTGDRLLAYTILGSIQDLSNVHNFTLTWYLETSKIVITDGLLLLNSLLLDGPVSDPNQQKETRKSDYSIASDLPKLNLDEYSKYTDSLDFPNLLDITECLTVYKNKIYSNNRVINGLEILIEDTDKTFISVYSEIPCLYIISESGSYQIISLMSESFYGALKTIKLGEIPLEGRQIKYVSGKYIYFSGDTVYDLNEEKIVENFGLYPNIYLESEYKRNLNDPSLSAITEDLIPLYRIGEWSVFNTINDELLYVSVSGSLLVNPKKETPYVLNNKCILCISTEPGVGAWDEKVLTLYAPDRGSNLKTLSYFNPVKEYLGMILIPENLDKGIIPIPIRYGAKLCPAAVDSFRHLPLRSYSLPGRIVGAYLGYIYYVENNKLYCL